VYILVLPLLLQDVFLDVALGIGKMSPGATYAEAEVVGHPIFSLSTASSEEELTDECEQVL